MPKTCLGGGSSPKEDTWSGGEGTTGARDWTQSESRWLPAAFIEKGMCLLHFIFACRTGWENRGVELGCDLRSGLRNPSIDFDNSHMIMKGH